MSKIENMKVDAVRITLDRGCILGCWVTLSGDGVGIGFGGYALDDYDPVKKERVGCAFGAEYIRRLMTTFKIESLNELEGQIVRARWNKGGSCGDTLAAIGHPVEDRWFDPKELAKEMGLAAK